MKESEDRIVIAGAREHNLKGFDLELPVGALIAVTGVSGSGKSSLAFDTLFREGQRRYLSSFSSFARLFLGKQSRPAADHLFGLAPALAVGQRGAAGGAGSTVGTVTELYDYLRLLFARLGEARCPACNTLLESRSPSGVADLIARLFADRRVRLLAPVVDDHSGQRTALLTRLAASGFERVRIDGVNMSLEPIPELDAAQRHVIEVEVAVLDICAARRGELDRAVSKALGLGNGAVIAVHGDGEQRYQASGLCGGCGAGFPHVGTRLFSFNSPQGACPGCKGAGICDKVDPALLVADPQKSLRGGAMVPTTPNGYIVYSQVTVDVMDSICREHGFTVDTPWCELTAEQQGVIFYGSDRIQVPFGKHSLESRLKWSGITAKPREVGYYKGLVPVIEETLKRNRNKNILRFVASTPCDSCGGTRLRPEALAVKLGGFHIAWYAGLTLNRLLDQLRACVSADNLVAKPILAGIESRVGALVDLGLGYLTCERTVQTLSGGEARRVRLAGQLGSGLSGLLHVLDEPSMGLHPHDRAKLARVLTDLRDQGNTVVTVEHGLDAMAAADWLVDIGPGAGRMGGELLYSGPPAGIDSAPESSVTRDWLLGRAAIPVPSKRRLGEGRLIVRGARQFNLKDIDVHFLLGAFNVVTGVSGSGKSTLTDMILARSLRRDLNGARVVPGDFDGLEGAEPIRRVIHVDQSPIGRTPRSNPATYTNLMDTIRDLFAREESAKQRGLKKSAFSLNVKGGRCEICQGAGVTVTGMHGLADVAVTCEACNGRRFAEDTLAVRYCGKSIRDVLDMTVEEAFEFFADVKPAARILDALMGVGLHYLTLGRSSTTLSGGEAQRVKLASELGKSSGGHAAYVLDEPSSGLHPADVRLLLAALNGLVDKGHTVVVVEHHPDLIKSADWVVDLGPGGGDEGGELVVQGTPEQAAACAGSHTGAVLGAVLSGQAPRLEQRIRKALKPQVVRLFGVNTHNLKNLDVAIPPGLTVITGPSGSGKSSLAFDTLFREGQRRFAENLSAYARRLLAGSGEGRLDRVEGLTPTIAVGRERGARDRRSTVGTAAEIYDYYRLLYSRVGKSLCPQCDGLTDSTPHGFTAEVFSARSFSFNHGAGACPCCRGLGEVTVGDPEALISAPGQSLYDGAMDGHKEGRFYGDPHGRHLAILAAVGTAHSDDYQQAWCNLSDGARQRALYGTGDTRYAVVWHFQNKTRRGTQEFEATWPGLIGFLEEAYARKLANGKEASLAALMTTRRCPECGGGRLRPGPAAVRFEGMRIADLVGLSVRDSLGFFEDYEQREGNSRAGVISRDIRAEITTRLAFLAELGLSYLSPDRSLVSLSGGELRRLRLATQLGARLEGITYVLDEPTTGLHERDTARLIQLLHRLCGRGNRVVVVEHDEAVIRAADRVIDMGPGAGERGGRIVAQGGVDEIMANPNSATGRYLAAGCGLERPSKLRSGSGQIELTGCDRHNLKQVNVTFPIGAITLVTGVSGAGKSSLMGCLADSLSTGKAKGCAAFSADLACEPPIVMDQKPLAGGVGTPATLMKCFDAIRDLFAKTETARANKLRKTAFSFTTKGGRCETCAGTGTVKTDMGFLADVTRVCEDCDGTRYGAEVLACLYRGHSIGDVLGLSVAQALDLFADLPAVADALQIMVRVGLGHLQLGRSTATLSGGEVQRLKLAAELQRGMRGGKRRVYLFDEPSTGLHFDDVAHLLGLFHDLADQGCTLVIAEHHPDVIAHADHVIELGPEGGEPGGRVLHMGPGGS